MLSIFLAKCTCVAPPLILSSISDREFVASAGHQQRDSLDTYEEGLWLQNGVSFITLLSGGGLRCGCGRQSLQATISMEWTHRQYRRKKGCRVCRLVGIFKKWIFNII